MKWVLLLLLLLAAPALAQNCEARPAGPPPKFDLPREVYTRVGRSWVRVETTIAADGTFTQVRFLDCPSDPDLERAILEALRPWSWEPAWRNGQPAESTVHMRFDQDLE